MFAPLSKNAYRDARRDLRLRVRSYMIYAHTFAFSVSVVWRNFVFTFGEETLSVTPTFGRDPTEILYSSRFLRADISHIDLRETRLDWHYMLCYVPKGLWGAIAPFFSSPICVYLYLVHQINVYAHAIPQSLHIANNFSFTLVSMNYWRQHFPM